MKHMANIHWLSFDEEKSLRKVKEVFRISRRSIPNLDRSDGRPWQPVTKVYNHHFATRVASISIGHLKNSQKMGGVKVEKDQRVKVMQAFFYSAKPTWVCTNLILVLC